MSSHTVKLPPPCPVFLRLCSEAVAIAFAHKDCLLPQSLPHSAQRQR